jgi:hypothetical protein
MAAMEKIDFRSAEPDAIVSILLRQGAVLLGNFVDTGALGTVHDMMLKAYEQVEGYHVFPKELRELGLPMYSDILFTARHRDVLDKLFGSRGYEISSQTASRRVSRSRQPPHWLPPLGPHLDAFIHAPQFTVNFWVPFQACGVDAPGIGVVTAPFAEILSFTGYENGAEIWADTARDAHFARFRPAMRAMYRENDPAVIAALRDQFRDRIHTPAFEPGDAMMLSNWTLHLTHATAEMAKTRENLELRFWSSASLAEIMRDHGMTLPHLQCAS